MLRRHKLIFTRYGIQPDERHGDEPLKDDATARLPLPEQNPIGEEHQSESMMPCRFYQNSTRKLNN
jgi:hypothetical protein